MKSQKSENSGAEDVDWSHLLAVVNDRVKSLPANLWDDVVGVVAEKLAKQVAAEGQVDLATYARVSVRRTGIDLMRKDETFRRLTEHVAWERGSQTSSLPTPEEIVVIRDARSHFM